MAAISSDVTTLAPAGTLASDLGVPVAMLTLTWLNSSSDREKMSSCAPPGAARQQSKPDKIFLFKRISTLCLEHCHHPDGYLTLSIPENFTKMHTLFYKAP